MTEGEQLKEEGIRRVTTSNQEWIAEAREEAARVAKMLGTVSSVELRHWAERTGKFPKHQNAWGAVFRGKSWEFTGVWTKCQHPDGHARVVRVWRHCNVN